MNPNMLDPSQPDLKQQLAQARAENEALRDEVSHLEALVQRYQASERDARTHFDYFQHIATLINSYTYINELTADGRCYGVYFSPDFETLIGYPLSDFIANWSFWATKFVHPDEAHLVALQLSRASAGLDSEAEYRLRRANGSECWVQHVIKVQQFHNSKVLYGSVSNITERKEREIALSKLLKLSQTLIAVHNPNAILDTVIQAAVDIAPSADRGSLQLLSDDGETLRTVAISEPETFLQSTITFRPGVGIAGLAVLHRQVINVADVLQDERFVAGKLPLRLRSLLVVPLLVKGHLLGTLSLSSRRTHAFTASHEALVQLIADQVAAALENTRLMSAPHLR